MKHLVLSVAFAVVVILGVGQFTGEGISYTTAYTEVQAAIEQPAQAVPAPPIPPYCIERNDICESMRKAGFQEDQLNLMMAISRAESGWRIEALGDTTITNKTWGPSVGVLQVRTINPGHPQGCRIREQLNMNLDAQTSCGYQIYKSQGYKAWSAYLNGSYKKFLK
jgi:hypothetical protein